MWSWNRRGRHAARSGWCLCIRGVPTGHSEMILLHSPLTGWPRRLSQPLFNEFELAHTPRRGSWRSTVSALILALMDGLWTRATADPRRTFSAASVRCVLRRNKAEVVILTRRLTAPRLQRERRGTKLRPHRDEADRTRASTTALNAHRASRRALRIYTKLANKLRVWSEPPRPQPGL
jgi:hypothetical protein